ncbi:MAG: redoxin domain-containing protein [Acidobacteria bacterium]|nr:redoxin domain-containing protein [Acidobacteriota bacterium]
MAYVASGATALVGRPAPDFTLPCTSGSRHSRRVLRLEDYRGRWLMLFFYPRDFSLICPTELSAMSARHGELAGLGAEVLAISTDPIEIHERWIATPRAQGGLGPVSFPVASDVQGAVTRAYGVCLEPPCIALRGLFIIDPNSIVQYQVVHNLSVGRRTDEILRVVTALQAGGLCAENWLPGRDTIDTGQLLIGTMVSHYRIEQKLGEGGFATVYLAHDTVLDRKVALKIVKQRDAWTPSLLTEARAAAALAHSNVCTVFAVDDSEGIVAIVMEYLLGQPLSRLIAGGPMPAIDALTLARQIASGLAAAHAARVVHGDLKPANIFVTDEGVAKILDFGLARRLPAVSSGDGTTSLDPNAWVNVGGTPAYMSPERAEGAPASLAGDIFAFGLTLYELLTGRQAFEGSNLLQVLAQVRTTDVETLARAVPERYASLLRSMLCRDPSERLTASELLERLASLEGVGAPA